MSQPLKLFYMPNLNIPISKKPVRGFPIILTPLSIREKNLLNEKILSNFNRFVNGEGNFNYWLDLAIRFHVTIELCKKFYEQETIDTIESIYFRLISIKERSLEENSWYMTEEELDWIKAGLEASNEIQNSGTRRMLLELHLKAKDFIQKTYITPLKKETQNDKPKSKSKK